MNPWSIHVQAISRITYGCAGRTDFLQVVGGTGESRLSRQIRSTLDKCSPGAAVQHCNDSSAATDLVGGAHGLTGDGQVSNAFHCLLYHQTHCRCAIAFLHACQQDQRCSAAAYQLSSQCLDKPLLCEHYGLWLHAQLLGPDDQCRSSRASTANQSSARASACNWLGTGTAEHVEWPAPGSSLSSEDAAPHLCKTCSALTCQSVHLASLRCSRFHR